MSAAVPLPTDPSLQQASDETLAALARAGGRAAREALILRHQSLVRRIAGPFRSAGFSAEDLMQAGTIGLIGAVDRFQVERGFRFTAYASALIRGELQHLVRDQGWAVRVPRAMQELSQAAVSEQRRLTQVLGRGPAVSEVASALGADANAVAEALTARNAYRAEHLEWNSDDDGDYPRPLSGGEGEFTRVEDRIDLAAVIQRLPHRERHIIIMSFEHEMTQAVIAEELQISQMHVSRLLRAALMRLHELLTEGLSRA